MFLKEWSAAGSSRSARLSRHLHRALAGCTALPADAAASQDFLQSAQKSPISVRVK